MGEVHLAQHIETGQEVAIKILPPELTRNPQYVERFRREAKTVAQLDHPNIIKVFEVGEEDGIHFFSMEYLKGRTLTAVLKELGRLSIPEAITIITNIADALDSAHHRGIVHRDIKPDNIISDENGVFKIMDFGIAHVEEGTQLTVTGSILGTPEYMSPDQASGSKVDRRTDIYSLGIVFYEMLTGRVPFQAETMVELLKMHITKIPDSPKTLNPEIPSKLAEVINKMVAKKPADRYSSFRHVVNAINQAVPRGLRAGVATQVREVEAMPTRAKERAEPRARERIIYRVPSNLRIVLAISVLLNLAFFTYFLFRPAVKSDISLPVDSTLEIGSTVYAPMAVSGTTMYLGAEDGTLFTYDLQTGAPGWTFKAGAKIEAAPIIDGDRVYVCSWDNHVYALGSSLDGQEIWKSNLGDTIMQTPVLSNGILYVCTRNGKVFFLDAETGDPRQTYNLNTSIKLSPIIRDEILLLASDKGIWYAFDAIDRSRLGEFETNKVKTAIASSDQMLHFVTLGDTMEGYELNSFAPNPAQIRGMLGVGQPQQKVSISSGQ